MQSKAPLWIDICSKYLRNAKLCRPKKGFIFLGSTVFNGKTIFTTMDTKVTKEKRL